MPRNEICDAWNDVPRAFHPRSQPNVTGRRHTHGNHEHDNAQAELMEDARDDDTPRAVAAIGFINFAHPCGITRQ